MPCTEPKASASRVDVTKCDGVACDVSSVLEEVTESLISGDSVKLSSFGTFSVQSKNERLGRNPKTGVEAVITPRRVLSFRPSNLMKKRINST